MSTRRQWTGLFAASLWVAACGGGGGGSSNGVVVVPPPPPPPPPNPVVIQASEITDAGTDRIVGLALDSLMAFASLGVLMERFGPELQRYIATRGFVPDPVFGYDGIQDYNCLEPHLLGAGSYSRTTTNYTDAVVKGVDSGDSLDIDYHNCGDWGLQNWNGTDAIGYLDFQLVGDPLGNGDWVVSSLPEGVGPRWNGVMQSVRFGQPAMFDSAQSFYIGIGGSVQRSGGDLVVSIKSRSDIVPSQLIASRILTTSSGSPAVNFEGRYLPVRSSGP